MNKKRLQDVCKYPRRILIVKLSSLGDIIQSLPVAAVLHRKFPSAQITWIVNRQYMELLELTPDIDKIIPFERIRWGRPINPVRVLREFIDFIKDIQAQCFDLVMDLQGLFRSGLITFLSKVPVRIGFRRAREGAFLFYTNRVEVPEQRMHAVQRYLTLAEYLGCEYKEPIFNLDLQGVPELFVQKEPYIAINPGGRWPTKHWPAHKFAQLIDRLQGKYKINIVLIGDENDKYIARDIINEVHPNTDGVIDLTGKTNLGQLVCVLKKCSLLITNDSGPMHLANALGRPVVVLFGPTDPGLTGPWGSQHRIVQSKVSCSPCFKRKCPETGRGISCMEAITVEEVLGAVEDILQK